MVLSIIIIIIINHFNSTLSLTFFPNPFHFRPFFFPLITLVGKLGLFFLRCSLDSSLLVFRYRSHIMTDLLVHKLRLTNIDNLTHYLFLHECWVSTLICESVWPLSGLYIHSTLRDWITTELFLFLIQGTEIHIVRIINISEKCLEPLIHPDGKTCKSKWRGHIKYRTRWCISLKFKTRVVIPVGNE